jgi:hypothetical protein
MDWLPKPIPLQSQLGMVDLIRAITQPSNTGAFMSCAAETSFDFDANDGAAVRGDRYRLKADSAVLRVYSFKTPKLGES